MQETVKAAASYFYALIFMQTDRCSMPVASGFRDLQLKHKSQTKSEELT